jgi:hypothetical protein
MRRAAQRFALAVTVVAIWAGAGSVSPAAATGGVGDNGSMWGQINNLTPYTWTFVRRTSLNCDQAQPGQACGFTGEGGGFPQTVKPGQSFVYVLRPYSLTGGGIAAWVFTDYYDGYFTYRVDAANGPEYVTFALSQTYAEDFWGNMTGPVAQVYNTVAPPEDSYDPRVQLSSGPSVARTPNNEVNWVHADQYNLDVTFGVNGGDYTLDATQAPHLADMLNALCSNAPGTTCAFKGDGPATWRNGQAVQAGESLNCAGVTEPGEDKSEPNWFEVSYKAAQSATLTVGGGLTVSAEFELFDIVGNEVSFGVEADHDWGQTKTETRTTRIYVPDNSIGDVWVAPTEAAITGTLTVTFGGAKYTIYNFSQTQSGISRDSLTPAFNVTTRTRAMTAKEIADNCNPSRALKATASTAAPKAKAASVAPAEPAPVAATAARLNLGHGVREIELGQTEAQIAKRLGKPRFKSPHAVDCGIMDPACSAREGRRGTWWYPQVSVVFGANRRAHTLIYRGREVTSKGVGVGSSYTKVRAAYPKAKCVRYVAQSTCSVRSMNGPRAVKTVFHFTHEGGDRRKVDRVLIHYHVSRGKA